jgi:hypothetical protein
MANILQLPQITRLILKSYTIRTRGYTNDVMCSKVNISVGMSESLLTIMRQMLFDCVLKHIWIWLSYTYMYVY